MNLLKWLQRNCNLQPQLVFFICLFFLISRDCDFESKYVVIEIFQRKLFQRMENENRSIFRQNEKVLCYHDKLLYEVWFTRGVINLMSNRPTTLFYHVITIWLMAVGQDLGPAIDLVKVNVDARSKSAGLANRQFIQSINTRVQPCHSFKVCQTNGLF